MLCKFGTERNYIINGHAVDKECIQMHQWYQTDMYKASGMNPHALIPDTVVL